MSGGWFDCKIMCFRDSEHWILRKEKKRKEKKRKEKKRKEKEKRVNFFVFLSLCSIIILSSKLNLRYIDFLFRLFLLIYMGKFDSGSEGPV